MKPAKKLLTSSKVDSYEILSVTKDGHEVKNFQNTTYLSADELYAGMDRICDGATKGNVKTREVTDESYIEGSFKLIYTKGKSKWVFLVWVAICDISPTDIAIKDLGLCKP